MSWFDLINGLFEAFGAYVAWRNFFRLRRDREIRGVVPSLHYVYACWGLWNIAFYPLVGAWFSAVVGAIMTAANVSWCVLAYRLAQEEYEENAPTQRFYRGHHCGNCGVVAAIENYTDRQLWK